MGRLIHLVGRHLVVVTTGVAVVLAGCSAPPPEAGTVPAATTVSTRPGKVLVIVLENHGYNGALRQMPFLASQSRGYAKASRYYAVTHPSLPNYLVLAGGSTFGVSDDKGPASHRLSGSSVFGQVIAHGRTAKTYAEGMQTRCQRTSTRRYAVRHNPWTYFASSRERSLCLKYDVPAGTTAAGALHRDVAAGRLPVFSMLIPDVCHDGHDCTLATADSWLKAWLRQIKAGPDFRAGRLAVVVTFDEDERTSRNHVLTTVIHPALHGLAVTRRLDHYSLSATASRLAGVRPLRKSAGTPNFLAAVHLRGGDDLSHAHLRLQTTGRGWSTGSSTDKGIVGTRRITLAISNFCGQVHQFWGCRRWPGGASLASLPSRWVLILNRKVDTGHRRHQRPWTHALNGPVAPEPS